MNDVKELIKMRNTFREAADIIDELLDLKEKENNGQDVKKELESVIGRFAIKMLELNSLQ
ncbi:hypothetical protein FQB35_15420 (plasmid) [Crassaminicella thermophila]|uniref:Uncharacterized protein n=1 Tax=Crassaminicella thermophila TaxID=2599308 RepID=A0A5C0SJ30_CRATE|nr:hypothetical protein [Crassaminicella thermophila]QEK13716.1 hypothetical protein FQB35_15420 [Crassaminicella thermophila]